MHGQHYFKGIVLVVHCKFSELRILLENKEDYTRLVLSYTYQKLLTFPIFSRA